MATAAPATGAPAPVAPAATPATPAGEPTAPQADAASQSQPKTIKPIPDRPRLPGVLEDGPEDASSPEAVAARERDAKGRFLKAGGEPVVQKAKPSAVDAAEGEPTIPDLPEATPKFKFAGREFESQAAAEHYVKSMEGRYKPIQEAATRHEAQLVKAAESARGWHAEAQRLQAELQALQSGAQQPAAQPEAAPESKGIDWELYREIKRVANEAGTPEKADQWLVEQIEAQRQADFNSWRESFETPFREREAAEAEQAQLAQTADTLVESMAAHTNPDGSPAFPEFRDGEQAREVGHLWQSLGLDPRLALTPGGAVAAVALYRMAKGMDMVAAAPAPAPVAPPSPDPAAAAAAGLEGGRTLMPAAATRRDMDPGTARLVAGLKNHQLIRPGLGFEA